MSKQIILLIISIIFTSHVFAVDKAKNINKRPKLISQKMKEAFYLEGETKGKSEVELKDLLRGYLYFVKQNTNPDKKLKLNLNIALTYLALAKHYRTKQKPTATEKDFEMKALRQASIYATEIINSKTIDKDTKTKAYYVQGLTEVYLDLIDLAQSSMKKALEVKPDADFAPNVSIFLAETAFDRENYHEAISYYRKYFAQLKDELKVLAVYKTAWCYYNLNDYEKAKEYFSKLIGQKWAKDFAKDSLRDLAQVAVDGYNENQIISIANDTIKDPQDKLSFLYMAQSLYEAKGTLERKNMLNAQILKLEPTNEKKLNFLIVLLHQQQRDYASREPLKELSEIQKFINESKIEISSDAFQKNSVELETEIRRVMKSYAETYSGHTKTPENISKDEIANTLSKIFKLTSMYFPDSDQAQKTYQLWLNLCEEREDLNCVTEVSKEMIQKFKEQRASLYTHLLVALEKLEKSDKKYHQEFCHWLKIAADEIESDPKWIDYAKRLTVIYMEEKKFKEALPYLQKIDSKESSNESTYRLNLARYQLGDYHSINMNQKETKFDNYTKLNHELIRESALRNAEESLQKKDFENYENNLKVFLQLNPNEEKADIVKRNFLENLYQRNDFKRIQTYLLQMSDQKKRNPQFIDFVQKTIKHYIKSGNSKEILELLENNQKGFELFYIMAQVMEYNAINANGRKALLAIDSESREYLQSVFALTNPDLNIELFRNESLRSTNEKSAMLLSYQVKAGEFAPPLDESELVRLSDILPKAMKEIYETPVEKMVSAIKFPGPKTSTKKLANQIQKIVEQIRKTRPLVSKDLSNKLPRIQIRILQKTYELEKKLADLITTSPLPPELPEAQKEEYIKGINEFASEFITQAQEYEKLAQTIQLKYQELQKAKLPTKDDWPWIKSDKLKPVVLLTEKNYCAGALFALEYLRFDSEISENDFYRTRLRILTEKPINIVIADVIVKGLQSNNQTKLVEEWQEKSK